MNITKFLCNIGRDQFKGLYLQCSIQLSLTEVANYKITNSNNVKLFEFSINENDIINNIYENSHIIYIPIDKFDWYTESFNLIVNNGTTTINKITTVSTNEFSLGKVNTISNDTLNGLITKASTEFEWNVDNFSKQYLYATLEVTDGNITIYDTERIIEPSINPQTKLSTIDITPFIKTINDDQIHIIKYRLKIREGVSTSNSFYVPNTDFYQFKFSKINNPPNILLNNINIDYTGNSYNLSLEAMFHDSDLDDIKYNIRDNQGNTIYTQDYYTYSPSIDNIYYSYHLNYFNSLFLRLNTEITDSLTYSTIKEFKYPLFTIKNLRIKRDRVYWELTNYSNAAIKTTVELLDMFKNIVYTGKTQINKTELKPILITDDQPIKLLQSINIDYYKFRVKVECEEENYIDYVEFENGTLVSNQKHIPPIITNIEGKLDRDLDNNKTLNLQFKVDGTDGDLFKYQIYDDSNNHIFSSRDYITTPSNINIKVPYDFVHQLTTNISIKVINEYNQTTIETINLDSYYIRNLTVFEGKIIRFDIDNYCLYDIVLEADAYLNKLNSDNEILYNDEDLIGTTNLTVENTIESIHKEMRFIPKLNGDGPFNGRIKVTCPDLGPDIVDYVIIPDKLISCIDNKPTITVNVIKNEFLDNNKMELTINITLTDIDLDLIQYLISDPYGTLISTDSFIELDPTSRTINVITTKIYDLKTISSSLIPIYIKVWDQEMKYSDMYYNIPLFSINNIFYDNGNFNWMYKIYTDNAIKMKLEILDNEGYLYGQSKEYDGFLQDNMSIINYNIDLTNYDSGTYRYRIKVYNNGDSWNIYYPNQYGTPINIIEPNRSANDIINKLNNDKNKNTDNISSIKYIDANTVLTTIYNDTINSGTLNTNLAKVIDSCSSNETKLSCIKFLLNLLSNYHDSKTYNLTSNNINNYKYNESFDNYANEINIPNRLNFYLTELNRFNFERHTLRLFSNGRKIVDDNYDARLTFDGLSKLYIGEDKLFKDSITEIASYKNYLIDAEKFSININIDSLSKIDQFASAGINIPCNINSIYPLVGHIIRNNRRIDLNRLTINRIDKDNINVVIKDILQLNDIVYITTNILYDRNIAYIQTELKKNNNGETYLKPVYFIPFSFVQLDTNVITNLNKAEVFIDGYCAVPTKDYTILPANDLLGLPSIILFKDLLYENTIVEIYYRDMDMDSSHYFNPVLNNVTEGYSYLELPSNVQPLIEGTFDVYQDNKKIPNDEYIILSDKHLAFKKSYISGNETILGTNKNIYNYHIKFNYSNNIFITSLLQKYNELRSTSYDITTLFNSLSTEDKSSLIKKSDITEYDSLSFIKFIYDMKNSEDFRFLEKIYKSKEYFMENGLCSNFDSLSNKDIIIKDLKIPIGFNHDINLSASTKLLNNNNNMEDNIMILNPSRILQIYSMIELLNNEINCNTSLDGKYDTYMNENISLDLDVINSDINLDAN